MTMRMTFLPSVLGKRAQSCVPLGGAAAQTRGKSGDEQRLEVTGDRNPGDGGEHERGETDEHRSPEARSAAAKRPGNELRRTDRTDDGADAAADSLVPLPERKADEHACTGGDHQSGDRGRSRAGEQPREEHANRRAETRADTDPVPATHLRASVVARFEPTVCRGKNRCPLPPRGPKSRRTPSVSNDKPLLVFFSSERSGPARRMESLLAHLARKERTRLRVMRVDVDDQPDLAERFKVVAVPTLVLVNGKRVVDRLDGRASAPKIEDMLDRHFTAAAAAA